jgi:hypothetical protein
MRKPADPVFSILVEQLLAITTQQVLLRLSRNTGEARSRQLLKRLVLERSGLVQAKMTVECGRQEVTQPQGPGFATEATALQGS